MSQNNSNDKAAMLAKIEGINKVDGFDPTPFAVDYTDLETGEVRKRLPVMIQMAWFRMKYPEGRIAITVSPGKDCFVATAKVYPSYKDGAECYLAEATASRGYLADKPSVSPREWAQTAAVGIALRNAGFGLQFAMAGDEFDMEKVNAGELTPMFFGSAMTNFGVQSFLEKFLELSPKPQPRMLQDGTMVEPSDENFSAFVFKIQANMNPAHRDRISFMRICSGVFEKGMSVYHKQSGKMVKLAQPQQFLAQERTIVEKAYPGDIIGVFDPGIFGIGDSLSDASQKLQFEDFPVFPPEIFARVQPKDSLKRKQFEKGIIQLSQEGAIQVFRQEGVGLESYIVGVVGVLQLEVLEYRLLNEYSSVLLMNQLPYSVARWVYAEDKKLIENIKGLDNGMLVYDKKDRPVILVNNEWSLNWILDRNPGIQFLTVPADVEKI